METSPINPHLANSIGAILLFGSIYSAILLAIYHRKFPASSEELTRTITQRCWSGRQVALLFAGFIGFSLLLSFVIPLLDQANTTALKLITVLLFAASQLAVLLMIGRKRKQGWNKDFAMRLSKLRLIPLSIPVYLAIVPVIGMATLVYQWILKQQFGMDISMQEVAELISQSHAWVRVGFIVVAVVVAPLYEELIFRGVLFPYLVRRIGLSGGIMAVSAVFALMHFHIPSALPLFLLSIALCLTYWRTGTLWTNIALHALFNGMTVVFLTMLA